MQVKRQVFIGDEHFGSTSFPYNSGPVSPSHTIHTDPYGLTNMHGGEDLFEADNNASTQQISEGDVA